VHARGADTPCKEAVTHRSRHCHGGIAFPECASLKVFVEPVLPVTANESMRSRDCRDVEAARYGAVQDIGAVAVRVHYIRCYRTADLAHNAAFPAVIPPTGMNRVCRYAM